jgi:hypothetical protein
VNQRFTILSTPSSPEKLDNGSARKKGDNVAANAQAAAVIGGPHPAASIIVMRIVTLEINMGMT